MLGVTLLPLPHQTAPSEPPLDSTAGDCDGAARPIGGEGESRAARRHRPALMATAARPRTVARAAGERGVHRVRRRRRCIGGGDASGGVRLRRRLDDAAAGCQRLRLDRIGGGSMGLVAFAAVVATLLLLPPQSPLLQHVAEWFNLTCDHSYRPPRLFIGDGTVQVLKISVPNSTVRINSS
ncbi:hypothetical protein ACP70R_016193 [Stipagrostis hirtigluma subsp. patula]